jgi:hypothetical protein
MGHTQLLQVGGFGWRSWQWGVGAGVPVSKASGVVLFHWLAWCGIGAGVPVLEAGGVVSFGWRGDMAPRGVCGVGGGARCHVVAVALVQLAWTVMAWQAVAYLWGLWWLVVRLSEVLMAYLVGLPL